MKRINLSKGQVAIVDDADFEWLSRWKWSAAWAEPKHGFYAFRTEKRDGKRYTVLMHREIMGLKHGDGLEVDHREPLSTLDNRRSNLRVATRQQNSFNRRKSANNTSGFKGVTFHKKFQKWQATIWVEKRAKYIGMYPTAEQAHQAYKEAALKFHGEFARYE